MKIAIVSSLLLLSLPLAAQYGPPAKDLEEGLFFMREIQRQLEPAINEARDRAVVFGLVARVQNRLVGKEPATEVAGAIKEIDDFLYRREQSGKALSRENLRTLESVRKELELAQPPYAILALRERLHHEFVHPLQRLVMKDMQSIEQFEREWATFVARHLTPTYREGISGITASVREPGQ